jgi:hypothetical protein
MMTEYKVIETDNIHALRKSVELVMETGWIPQGGICVVNVEQMGESTMMFYQAMVKVYNVS